MTGRVEARATRPGWLPSTATSIRRGRSGRGTAPRRCRTGPVWARDVTNRPGQPIEKAPCAGRARPPAPGHPASQRARRGSRGHVSQATRPRLALAAAAGPLARQRGGAGYDRRPVVVEVGTATGASRSTRGGGLGRQRGQGCYHDNRAGPGPARSRWVRHLGPMAFRQWSSAC